MIDNHCFYEEFYNNLTLPWLVCHSSRIPSHLYTFTHSVKVQSLQVRITANILHCRLVWQQPRSSTLVHCCIHLFTTELWGPQLQLSTKCLVLGYIGRVSLPSFTLRHDGHHTSSHVTLQLLNHNSPQNAFLHNIFRRQVLSSTPLFVTKVLM